MGDAENNKVTNETSICDFGGNFAIFAHSATGTVGID
jgi:hypothetical protein